MPSPLLSSPLLFSPLTSPVHSKRAPSSASSSSRADPSTRRPPLAGALARLPHCPMCSRRSLLSPLLFTFMLSSALLYSRPYPYLYIISYNVLIEIILVCTVHVSSISCSLHTRVCLQSLLVRNRIIAPHPRSAYRIVFAIRFQLSFKSLSSNN